VFRLGVYTKPEHAVAEGRAEQRPADHPAVPRSRRVAIANAPTISRLLDRNPAPVRNTLEHVIRLGS
jgi:hypothetical protein